MSDLDDLIDLQITVSDRAPEKPGFGTALILAYHTAWLDRVREYSRAADLLDDGFTVDHPVYKIASALKSQSPSPNKFKVGRKANIPTQIVRLEPQITTQGFVYEGTVNGVVISYTVLAGATVASISTAIELLIEAVTDVSSVADATGITATSTAGKILAYSFGRGMKLQETTADAGVAADLAAVADEDNDWYGLLTDVNSEAEILAVAAWTEANQKIYIPQSADWDIIDAGQTTDVATLLVALAYTRMAGIYHSKIGEWANAAWLATQLTPEPGSYTAAFKTLAGIAVDDLRAGEKSALATKRWTRYARQGGINITFEGKTPSGRFIDVTRFVDWLYAEIQTDVYSLLVNNPKLPYTNAGIAAVKGAVAGALRKGQEAGGLADDTEPVVTAPDITETDTTDRANRLLRNVEFTARLSGALHSIKITGNVSV